MPWLLNIVYGLLIATASPVLLYRALQQGKYRAGWREKLLGDVPDLEPAEQRLWLHAVSVGEVLLLKGLIAELQSSFPHISIVLTTTTVTGHEVAKTHYPGLTVCYCPLDFSWAVRRAIGRLKPTALVLAELELWPNLIRAASKKGVRLAIINGRLSEKSFRGYRLLRPMLASLLRRFDAIAVQSDEYASRFLALGAPPERVSVTGSVKFDGVRSDRRNPQTNELREAFGIAGDEPVFIAGSTQHPEEQYALDTWQALRREFPKLRLILVPRHKERFEEVTRLAERNNLPLVRRSRRSGGGVQEPGVRSQEPDSPPDNQTPDNHSPLTTHHSTTHHSPPVLLLDTLGELGACWGLADVAFVGGSLTDRGGQNMIEPAAYGAAVLFGPNTWNFREVVALLRAAEAAITVHNPQELTQAVRDLIGDPARRKEMGTRAGEAVLRHRGATQRTVKCLADAVIEQPDADDGRRAA